jgi:DNA repair protein SbcD/Mre11
MRILHFADLHLGVENYGRIDPSTGLSSRLGDFLSALDRLVDYAVDTRVDLVLFCGDAYKTREPSQTQQREFARRINRLSNADIPILLLVGNHDQPNAAGRATTAEIFGTLAVKNVYVANNPDIYAIPTASGPIQIAALPWLRRSALLAKDETKNLSFEQIQQVMQKKLTNIIDTLAERIKPDTPAILAGHVLVGDATVKPGSETLMAMGQEHALLLSNVALPVFDYVALGHIHRHQVLCQKPPVVYAGSLERVDFSEEDDEKGFCVVDIPSGATVAERHTAYEFHVIQGRRFLTISVSLTGEEIDPAAAVLRVINEQVDKARDAVVRLNIKLPMQLEGQLRDNDLRQALKDAHYLNISRDVQREVLTRLGNWKVEGTTPLEALQAWMATKNMPEDKKMILMEYAAKLIHDNR